MVDKGLTLHELCVLIKPYKFVLCRPDEFDEAFHWCIINLGRRKWYYQNELVYNTGGTWDYYTSGFSFDNDSDAILFKIMWG